MIAVIPYRQPKETSELRYAIRSLVKYFTPLSGIVLVGNRPDWYKGEHIPCNDIRNRKEFSIYTKLMQVSGKVLYTNDDYFALKPFDETLPNYYNHPCRDKHPKDGVYRNLYRNCPGEWLNFDVHCPMVIDTSLFTEWPIDRPIKTAYANTNKLPGEQMEDCKIKGNVSYEDIMERIDGRLFFSTNNNVHYPGMARVMQELYPLPSVYEVY